MNVSVIICSYGRPESLSRCLASVDAEAQLYAGTEIILVYTAKDEGTGEAMKAFANSAHVPVKILRAEKRGLSVARNVGIANASGDLLFFTDDDCIMNPGHLGALIATMESEPEYDYGGGAVRDIDAAEAFNVRQKTVIKPRTLFQGGVVSGANMFYRKAVFQKLGGFREDMGAASGTSFVGPEDLEMAERASFCGMTGVLLPNVVIIHDHKRAPGSPEMQYQEYAYDVSRGSFYAYMMLRGIFPVWNFWASTVPPGQDGKMDKGQIVRLQREFFGAAEYLKYCLEKNIDLEFLRR